MALTFALSAALAVLLTLACPARADSKILASKIGYSMNWTYTSTNITITLTANWSGYLGFGFSPNGAMAGADIVILYPRSGIIVLEDRHGVGQSLPALDAKQDYKLIYSTISSGQMTATFVRALDTCDADDAVLKPYTTKVIYAYGSVDASGIPQYHGMNHGVVSAYLLSATPASPSDSGVFNIDPIPQNITVPNNTQTTYWCSVVPFPRVENKSHIIEMQPMITPGNEDMVHHILVFSCSSVNLNFTSYNCLTNPGGGNLGTCTTMLAVWAVGGQGYRFPPNAGLPTGGQNTTQYVLIETHYNNMMLTPGRVDASYMRFKATPKLRQYDAGILETGVVGGIFVPPNVTQMLVAGYCAPSCLSQPPLPASGITVFSVMLHAHLLGRRVTLRKISSSNSTQPSVIADDMYYDFDYQDMWNFETPVQIMPGDALQTVCAMSSASRSTVTQGGLGTENEMCLSFLFYYPKVDLKTCFSNPSFTYSPADPLYGLLGKNASSFQWATFTSTNDGLAGAKWSDQVTRLIQSEYFNGTVSRSCDGSFQTYNLPPAAAAPLPIVNTTSPSCLPALSSTMKATATAMATATATSPTTLRSHGLRATTAHGVTGFLCAAAVAAAGVAVLHGNVVY